MLSDEEKKIIDKLKNGKKYTLVEIIRVFKKEGIENFRITRKEYLDIILNLIENQSKEIEELKKYEKYYEEMEEVNKKFIEVDKIRAKIEIRKEEKENCKDSIEEKYLLREIYVLQSLLEEED